MFLIRSPNQYCDTATILDPPQPGDEMKRRGIIAMVIPAKKSSRLQTKGNGKTSVRPSRRSALLGRQFAINQRRLKDTQKRPQAFVVRDHAATRTSEDRFLRRIYIYIHHTAGSGCTNHYQKAELKYIDTGVERTALRWHGNGSNPWKDMTEFSYSFVIIISLLP